MAATAIRAKVIGGAPTLVGESIEVLIFCETEFAKHFAKVAAKAQGWVDSRHSEVYLVEIMALHGDGEPVADDAASGGN